MAFQFTIWNKTFSTQKELTDHISKILKMPKKAPLNTEDSNFAKALLEYHHEKKVKIGCGIDYITVDTNQGGTTSFYIYRKDGTHDDFSSRTCIDGYKKSMGQKR